VSYTKVDDLVANAIGVYQIIAKDSGTAEAAGQAHTPWYQTGCHRRRIGAHRRPERRHLLRATAGAIPIPAAVASQFTPPDSALADAGRQHRLRVADRPAVGQRAVVTTTTRRPSRPRRGRPATRPHPPRVARCTWRWNARQAHGQRRGDHQHHRLLHQLLRHLRPHRHPVVVSRSPRCRHLADVLLAGRRRRGPLRPVDHPGHLLRVRGDPPGGVPARRRAGHPDWPTSPTRRLHRTSACRRYGTAPCCSWCTGPPAPRWVRWPAPAPSRRADGCRPRARPSRCGTRRCSTSTT
jgi:hypothetical protein